MDTIKHKIKNCIYFNDERSLVDLLSSGIDPNIESGWPIRLAARFGLHELVKSLLHYGANPHLLCESGASTLQLAVYGGSSSDWEAGHWGFLLACSDSSQLADGAAVATVFGRHAALRAIVNTQRCNTRIPTTLTGRTVESLARGYNMLHLLEESASSTTNTVAHSPSVHRRQTLAAASRPSDLSPALPSHRDCSPANQSHRNLSPLPPMHHRHLFPAAPMHRSISPVASTQRNFDPAAPSRTYYFPASYVSAACLGQRNPPVILGQGNLSPAAPMQGNLSPNAAPGRSLSPSVARFFQQTAHQRALTPPSTPNSVVFVTTQK